MTQLNLSDVVSMPPLKHEKPLKKFKQDKTLDSCTKMVQNLSNRVEKQRNEGGATADWNKGLLQQRLPPSSRRQEVTS